MRFSLYSGNKLELLAGKFREKLVSSPLSDVFVPETVVVQTLGMAAYLKRELGKDGRIAANLATPFPVNFIHRILECAFPGEFRAESERFSAEVLPFRIYLELERYPERYPELARYLAEGQRALKRYQLSCRIAELFDQYRIYRSDLLESWRRGGDGGFSDAEWQRRLYLELCGDERTREYYLRRFFQLEFLARENLPERITVFGVGSLPPLFLNFFLKLSEFVPVAFFYLNPSKGFWAEQYSRTEVARLIARDGGEWEDFQDGNPLLGSCGAQGREFFRYMTALPEVAVPEDGELFEDYLETVGEGPDDYCNPTRLTALQQDIFSMFRRGEEGVFAGKPFDFPAADRSVRVHNCHSARREVEVLHDQLLELLESGEIQPRDVIVMAPEIDDYAPCIDSVFGQGPLAKHYAVSDRSYRSGMLAEGFFTLLSLRNGNFELSKVLELLRISAVHTRFGISAGDFATLEEWIAEAGIRWGVDAADREAACGVGFSEYSWRQGLDRLLLGFARPPVAADFEGDGVLPLERIETEAEMLLLGRFIRFMERLFSLKARLIPERTPEEWGEQLTALLEEFFEVPAEEFDAFTALRRALLAPARRGMACRFDSKLPLEVIQEAVEDALVKSDRFDPFLRGRITFCSMVPMRSIPMKVVAILGLNDGVFPRRDIRVGFNLVNRRVAPCDRSRQAEDRYLFLEAILSARKSLLFFYQGQSARGDELYPPAIPLAELMDYLKKSAPFEEIRHRLQPFESVYFDRNNRNWELRSRSEENFLAARSLIAPKSGMEYGPVFAPVSPEPLLLTPDELFRFFVNPCRYFLRTRAGIFPEEDLPADSDAEPVPEEFAGLGNYLLRSEVGTFTLEGLPRGVQYNLLRRSSRLPVGRAGELLFDRIHAAVNSIPPEFREGMRRRERVAVDLETGGARITGVLEFHPGAQGNQQIVYTRIAGKYAVSAFLRHLLFNMTAPVATRLLCFEPAPVIRRFKPVEPGWACERLGAILELFRHGLSTPLPFFNKSSWSYALTGDTGKAACAFHTPDKFIAAFDDYDDPAVRCCFPPAPFEDAVFTKEFIRCAATLLAVPEEETE